MDALDVIIRGVHERLVDIELRMRRLERVAWFTSGGVALAGIVLKLSGCV